MNIIYGISGEKLGHGSRAKAVIPFLLKKGHKVLVLTYGDAYKDLKNFFKTFKGENLEIAKIEGFRLHYTNKKLDVLKTSFYGAGTIMALLKKRKKISRKIENFGADVCITDFEPFVAYYSKYKSIPLVSMDNMRILSEVKFPVPMKYKKDYSIVKTTIRLYVPGADYKIIPTFTKSYKVRKNVFLVNPVLRESIVKLKNISREESGKVLVYLNSVDSELTEIFKKINKNFIVYGFEVEKKEGNITFKKRGEQFIYDLAKCEAVISSAGFSLMSEAVYLRKPMFLIPQIGQFEQTSNAIFAKKEGFGEYSERPTYEEIKSFLENLEKYKKNLRKREVEPYEALEVLDKILNKINKQILLSS